MALSRPCLNGQTGALDWFCPLTAWQHGISIDNSTGLGYGDSSETQTTTIFNLKTLRTVTIPALKEMAIDQASNQVFVRAGVPNTVMPIDLDSSNDTSVRA